eukprot:CAMPEP_0119531650 /NCGR_PEP_ID=MMETSP1344-20130328/45316_1 /TAXON_ID=236787 /ORGANISM="Florenciella parvula, Strain CCMP2471" /LENGTH=40 /DNA_ID= /DNA_START= /DNA_END= /DNA_ORIENTATION=
MASIVLRATVGDRDSEPSPSSSPSAPSSPPPFRPLCLSRP